MPDCIFCKIVKKEMPADFIYEDSHVIAFKDIKPSAPVHYLVVSKEHIPSIAHLRSDHKDVIAALIFVGKEVAELMKLKGYKLVFNVGREGGQIIDHLHLHVLGGWQKGGGLHLPHPGLDK